MQLPTPDDVLAASRRIAGHVVRTPMLRHRLLDEIAGGTVLLKAEPLQRTGSFKLRGAMNAVLQLGEAERRAGVVTHSSGNHGQALACAASAVGACSDHRDAVRRAAHQGREHRPLGRPDRAL